MEQLNLILSMLLLLTVSFAFATNEVEKVSTYDVEETLELESTNLMDREFVDIIGTTYCFRDCVVIEGVVYCTPWRCYTMQ